MNVIDEFLSEPLILEESVLGSFSRFYCYVNSNDDGSIPHFHVQDGNPKNRNNNQNSDRNHFHCCIQITKNNYFIHPGKNSIFNSKERKDLDKFLNSKITSIPKELKYTRYHPTTNWEALRDLWNVGNRNQFVPLSVKKPDYTTINLER